MSVSERLLYWADVEVSGLLESNGFPDPYWFDVNPEGKLVPRHNPDVLIEDIVIASSFLGKVELAAFKKIQEWVCQQESGYCIWISPPWCDFYPTAKIVISEIVWENGRKMLLNRAIVVPWDELKSVRMAQKLALLAGESGVGYQTPADVHGNPIFVAKNKEPELKKGLGEILDPRTRFIIDSGEDFAAKQKCLASLLAGEAVPLGIGPRSCPNQMGLQTAFRIFSGEADQYGPLEFKCPHEGCGGVNKRQPGWLLEYCRYCGRSVRCR